MARSARRWGARPESTRAADRWVPPPLDGGGGAGVGICALWPWRIIVGVTGQTWWRPLCWDGDRAKSAGVSWEGMWFKI
jgi:hypothetical protein